MGSDVISGKSGLGPRCAAWLKAHYPEGRRIKMLCRDLRIGPSRANELLAGAAPTSAQLEELVARFGAPFLRHCFVEALAREDARLAELERELERLRNEVDRLADGKDPQRAGRPQYQRRQVVAGPDRVAALLAELVAELTPAPWWRRFIMLLGR
jgi:hypothetical protein